MASRKEYEMMFQLSAQLGGNFNGTFSTAQKALLGMQKEIEALSKTQNDISAYQKQQSAIENTKRKLETLQTQYDNIKREMDETGSASSSLQNKLLSKQEQIDKTNNSLKSQTDKLGQMGDALNKAGVDTNSLGSETDKLGKKIDDLKAKEEAAASKAGGFGTATAEAFSAAQQAIVAAGIDVALKKVYDFFASCSEASRDFESAMTGVAKTTDLTDAEFASMSDDIKRMSTVIPETTTQLAAISETAGQLGIEKSNLMSFTEIMAELGTATNMTSDEAATMLAQFASITGMDPSYYSNLGSAIVDLGNNYATTEKNITEMSQAIAAAGSISGMSEADIVGISAAVTSLGISSENGGTQMTKLISSLNSAVSSGDGLEDWAKVAGMSADQFAAAWGTNAAGALDTFIQGLHGIYESGGDVYGTLSNLGITETRMVTMITSLAKSGDRLTDTLQTSNKAWSENTALQNEAQKRYATTESQLTLMKNAYNNLKVSIGDAYTPALQGLYKEQTKVLEGITAFTDAHPGAVRAITAFVGVLGLVVAALTSYAAIAKVVTAVNAMLTASIPGVNVIMGITVAVAGVTAALTALGAANEDRLDESWQLTAASRKQYNELQELNAQYKEACDVYGKTSYEAQSLQWKINDLNNEYESGKQTLEDYKSATDDVLQSYKDMVSKHQDTSSGISDEAASTDSLILKLEQLTSTSDGAAKNQQAILAIVGALNEQVPGLALSYEKVTNNTGGFLESIRTIAQAQAKAKKMSDEWSEYVDRVSQQDTLKTAKEQAENNAKIAQSEYDTAVKAYQAKDRLYSVGASGFLTQYMETRDEAAAMQEAQSQLETYNQAVSDTTSAYNENEDAIKSLEGSLAGYTSAESDAISGAQDITSLMDSASQASQKLAESYKTAYDAAYTSISGQYNLWDQAAQVVAINADTINSNLQSQITYWEQYNTNLQSLTARTGEVAGLGDMLKSFADGSQESVATVAGMASASDSQLAAMVSNWKTLKQQQETTSGSLADVQTKFTESMNSISQSVQDAVSKMNLSTDATAAAKNTVQGYINGASAMLPQVQAAYAKVAQAAKNALDAGTGNSTTPVPGHASGTPSADPGFALVGENGPELVYFNGGERVLNAAETEAAKAQLSAADYQITTFAPQLFSALSARSDAISAMPNSSSSSNIVINLSPSYVVSGVGDSQAVEAALRSNDDRLRELVADVIDERASDIARRSYN